jgi:hypothetical protein
MRPPSDTFAGTIGAHESVGVEEAHAYLAQARTLVDARLESLVPAERSRD